MRASLFFLCVGREDFFIFLGCYTESSEYCKRMWEFLIFQFKVTLKDISPTIWRRFQVENNITFHQFHMTLQIVMGWEDRHLYAFDFGDKTITIPDPEYSKRSKSEKNSRKERVYDHFSLEGQQVMYLYDFGDGWEHEVVLEKILPLEPDKAYPNCLGGERSCPQEDCGGVFGHQETVSGLGEGYDTERFDIEAVNSKLKKKAYQLKQYQQQKKVSMNKPVKLTAAKLKKQLLSLSHPELVQLLIESFQSSKQMEQFLTVKLIGEEAVEALFSAYQKKVKDEFFPDRGFGKLRLTEAKKAIDEFEKITRSQKYTLELKLYYVELGVEFTNTFGDVDARFYDSIVNMYASVVEMINDDDGCNLFEEYEERIATVVEKTEGIGWGFHDNMQYLYDLPR